jgi:hypothetical protein
MRFRALAVALLCGGAGRSHAGEVATAAAAVAASPAPPRIAGLAPADDARKAVVIGVDGEVYEPDGQGGWIHTLRCATATQLGSAGRAGPAGPIVALGDGVVYRLASNGWSAIRLVQRGKAILGSGDRAVAAVGRRVFALDRLIAGEPAELAVAPGPIVGLGGGKAIALTTATGAFRLAGARLIAIPGVPGDARLVGDRWALVDRGAHHLPTGKLTRWPDDFVIAVAAVAPDDGLAVIGTARAGLELATLRGGKLVREPLGITGTAVGVVVDRSGRAVVALGDGRIAMRDRAGWTTTQVTDATPEHRPGAAPAISQ